MAALYVVATPIGNLEDITIRALNTLKGVDFVLCEDTRHSGRLLAHFDIRKPLLACHAHNQERVVGDVVARMQAGHSGAMVTDAGTPGISDPGGQVVAAVRAHGLAVVPIPGPSALAALLSIAGVAGKAVLFEGFLSPKKGRRRKRLAELLERGEIAVFYESPHRIVQLLQDVLDIQSEATVLVGREMTKLHEEYLFGPVAEVLEQLGGRAAIKGECTVLVSPAKKG
ncbi:MAG: 16S rRNA (cytidine(1402)-2'-O)-methyltransferase [Spirochaetaceae bacterium]|nr:MAG: 16S rRNA (cytidine(1402)-2'-O)-methyltransferase [Spirochaetaceae bacterium]